MGMKVTNLNIERLVTSKPEIFGNKKLSAKLIYWLARLQRDIDARLKEYGDARTILFEKYCLREENGVPKFGSNGEFQFAPEVTGIVAKELNELRMEVVEVGPYERIKLDLTDKTLEGVLSPNDLSVLEPFLDVTEPV
jgi:hypothetical protein